MGEVWSSAANHGGQLVGALIGIFWVMLGGWWVAIGRRRSVVAAHWQRVVGKIVDKNGGTEGLIARNPHLAYAASDGSAHRVPSHSRWDSWEPGQDVDVLVDPDVPGRAMLASHAERGGTYVVIGWFIVVVGVLTLIASLLLAVATPTT